MGWGGGVLGTRVTAWHGGHRAGDDQPGSGDERGETGDGAVPPCANAGGLV